jgi:peptidyl-prolyl cis-trans isomerase A (cyclophilin A)
MQPDHVIPNGLAAVLLACLGLASCAGPSGTAADPPVPTAPADVSDSQPVALADETYQVKLETSRGDVIIEVHPDWAPRGAARFKELVEAKFYDDCRFFRVLDGFMAQIGMNGDPKVNDKWRENRIKDDPVKKSNTKGMVTFATSGKDSRTTQFFINYGDNKGLDGQGFSPFGQVVKGMDVIESLYKDYGEGAPRGRGPSQGQIGERGNEYLNKEFPKLDFIKTARIVGADGAKKAGAEEEGAGDAL